MAILYANNTLTTLASNIAASDLTLTVASGTGSKFPSPTGGDYCIVTVTNSSGNTEIMHCTSRTGDILTVDRAQESTVARAFGSGSVVECRLTAGTMTYVHSEIDAKQPLDITLTALAGVTTSADKLIYATASDTFTTTDITAAARSVLDDASVSDMRTTLGLAIGTDVQAFDATLAALAATTTTADKLIYATGIDAFATCDFTAFARTLLGTASADVARAALGIQSSSADTGLSVMYALLYCRSQSRASGPIPNGYLFPLITDVLVTKTNATYDSSGKYYYNAPGASAISQSSGTAIGNATEYGGLAAAFDGVTSQTSTSCALTAALTANTGYGYCGKDWGAGVTHTVSKVSWRGSSDYGLIHDASGTVTAKLQGSNDNTNWADLGTTSVTDPNNNTAIEIAATSYTAYRYHRIAATQNAGSYRLSFGEVVFYDYVAPGNMTLIPAAVTSAAHPSSVTVRFLHKAVDSVTYGTDLKVRVSTDGGTNWSGYGSITKLCAYDADYDLLEAVFDTSGLTGTTLNVEITTYNTKSQRVAGIALGYAA